MSPTPRPGQRRSPIDFRSTQCIDLPCPPNVPDKAWGQPHQLASMLRDYLSVAERCARGLVRLRWRDGKPAFILVWPPLTLIAMDEPTWKLSDDRRAISVAVVGGLLASREPAGILSLVLERRAQAIQARVELLEYQPRVAGSALVWVYVHTQARVHASVGHRYLRELYQRSLATSACH